MQLFAELKRRKVIRVAGLYLVTAWLLVQVAETLLPIFGTLLSIAILGETFHLYHAVALVTVLGGIWLAEHSGRKMR